MARANDDYPYQTTAQTAHPSLTSSTPSYISLCDSVTAVCTALQNLGPISKKKTHAGPQLSTSGQDATLYYSFQFPTINHVLPTCFLFRDWPKVLAVRSRRSDFSYITDIQVAKNALQLVYTEVLLNPRSSGQYFYHVRTMWTLHCLEMESCVEVHLAHICVGAYRMHSIDHNLALWSDQQDLWMSSQI